jgi:HlyD family secretion protein
VAFLILLVAAVAGLAWSLRTIFPRPVQEVEAFRVRRGSLEITLPLVGVFEARTVEMAFDGPGRLASVAVSEGQAVRAGALIAAVEAQELQAAVHQAAGALRAARADAERAAAAQEAAHRQANQAESAYRAAQAALAQVQAGPRAGELQQAEAAVDAAKAAVEESRALLERTEQLFREGAVSQAQLDGARSQREAAEARYRQAVAQRDLLRAGARPEAVAVAREQVRQAAAAREVALANVRQAAAAVRAAEARLAQAGDAVSAAQARLGRTELRAPFDGTITRVYLNAGSFVGPGIPVASLAAPGGWVTADVDEADIGRVRVGQVARVTAEAYPGQTFTGRVTHIGRQVEARLGTRIVRVRVDLDGTVGMRVGTNVDIRLVEKTISDVLLVPVESVTAAADDGPRVFLVEGGTLRRREVRTGDSDQQFAAILQGVREGDQVAVGEPERLRDGLRVRVTSVR